MRTKRRTGGCWSRRRGQVSAAPSSRCRSNAPPAALRRRWHPCSTQPRYTLPGTCTTHRRGRCPSRQQDWGSAGSTSSMPLPCQHSPGTAPRKPPLPSRQPAHATARLRARAIPVDDRAPPSVPIAARRNRYRRATARQRPASVHTDTPHVSRQANPGSARAHPPHRTHQNRLLRRGMTAVANPAPLRKRGGSAERNGPHREARTCASTWMGS
jgi:hypothetical protein